MRRFTPHCIGLVVAASAANCSFSHDPAETTTGPGSTPVFDGAVVERGGVGSDGTVATADSHCDSIVATPNKLPPDILIVLDRSGSMNNDITDKPCNGACPAPGSKWTQMTAAIKQAVMASETTVKWGLKFFGNDNACGINAGAAVGPALNNSAAITAQIDMTTAG